MYKKIIIALCCSFSAIAQAELLTDKYDKQINSVNLEILLERAPLGAQKNLLKNKQEVKQQLERLYIRKVLAELAVKEGLDKQGLNAERLQAIRENSLYLLKLDALRASNKKDYSKYAKQIYRVNKSNYPIEARVNAAHILISTKDTSDADALKKASEIRQKLILGEKFADLAMQESADKSVKNNKGEMGNFTRGQMVKPFSDAAFAMQPGEISEPVKTRYGYHIVKLNKKIPAGVKPFDEVKASIIKDLKAKDWEITRAEFFEKLLKDNEMQIDDVAVDEFIATKLDELNSESSAGHSK